MIDVLNLVFHSFWTFIGSIMLIGAIGTAAARIAGTHQKKVPPLS